MQNEDFKDLLDKINRLEYKQNDLKIELETLRAAAKAAIYKATETSQTLDNQEVVQLEKEIPAPAPVVIQQQPRPTPIYQKIEKEPAKPSDLERLIGENIANKVGMLITVLGVAIGVKYAIDHELISPIMRVILGYLMGIGLLGTSMRLRKNYFELSAVILSGALAVFYFITFAAFDYYHLLPQSLTFAMMALITIFAALSALSYDKMLIALGGMVGAYAIPFLLSSGEDHSIFLLSYVLLINIGILYLAFKRNWSLLYYLAFFFTWCIYLAWLIEYSHADHINIGLIFATLYFGLFYTAFMAYKIVQNEKFDASNILILITNALFYYGAGMILINNLPYGNDYTGLFTLANAVVHFFVSRMVYKRDLADKSLFMLVSGLVILFITLVFPVQFDGFKVTMFWAMEMALLYFIGRKQDIPAYQKLSFPLIPLVLLGLFSDWTGYHYYSPEFPETFVKPILNVHFFTTFIALASFIFMFWAYKKYETNTEIEAGNQNNFSENLMKIAVPIISTIIAFFLFFNEIDTYFSQAYTDSFSGREFGNENINLYKNSFLFIYTMLFISILNILLKKYLATKQSEIISIVLSIACVLAFILFDFENLTALKLNYFYPSGDFSVSIFALIIRYVSLAFLAFLIYTMYQNMQRFFQDEIHTNIWFDLFVYGTLLCVLSTEVMDWMYVNHSPNAYTFGLSILFGIFSLALIVYGIYAKKKHLRIGAIALFTITLVKLFLYDLAGSDTITKTILLVSLGLLLLLISFLYNKYKDII